MRIAVTYENGEIFQHFGHTERFKVYDVEGGGSALLLLLTQTAAAMGRLRTS